MIKITNISEVNGICNDYADLIAYLGGMSVWSNDVLITQGVDVDDFFNNNDFDVSDDYDEGFEMLFISLQSSDCWKNESYDIKDKIKKLIQNGIDDDVLWEISQIWES